MPDDDEPTTRPDLRHLLPHELCPACEGKGTKMVLRETPEGRYAARQETCEPCGGAGVVAKEAVDRVERET